MECSGLSRGSLWFLLLLTFGILSCKSVSDDSYQLSSPQGFPSIEQPKRNIASQAGVILGEKLFSDPILSIDSSISCASCHIPSIAFTDGQSLNKNGFSRKSANRNTPTLLYVAWSESLFWDGGSYDLESQVFAPLLHPDELGNDLPLVVSRINQNKTYKKLFKDAFGIDSITSKNIARAIAQYERTLWYANSDYDLYIKGKRELTKSEQEGLKLFQTHCNSCHTAPLFSDYKYHNVLGETPEEPGELGVYLGRFRITRDSTDIGSYKTPTLRNVKVTSPYFHDGREPDLTEAIRVHPIQLSAQEVDDLVQFLGTLTDSEFL